MIEKIINRFNKENKSPFEIGKAYYNADVGDRFVVVETNPNLQLRYSKTGQTLFYDKDVYKMKYEEGIIREVDG